MTDIRLSRPEEIPAQKRLWKTAFGDDDAFIDWFYDCRGPEAQVPVVLEDGAVVSIEIIPSVTGKSVFYTAISTEHTICTLHGTQMELEEIRDILDHLELSQLLTYQPEPTE